MIKKCLSLIVALCMAFMFAGCGSTEKIDPITFKVGALKGPTTIGIVNMIADQEDSDDVKYDLTMATQPSEIVASVVKGDIDIALIPANAAAAVYQKTEGAVSVVDINTLGVLYCVTGDDSITSVKDLAGKTVLSTGQGATPEYSLNYLLEQNGVKDCTVEFKSEATEIAAVLKKDPTKIAVLPQPFVTVAEAANDQLKTAFSLSDEWDKVTSDSKLITGVTIVRNEVLENNEAAVKQFLKDHAESVEKVSSDLDTTAKLVVEQGIIAKEAIARKAIPECNIVCETGDEMKTALSGYLSVLYNADKTSVGGALPEDGFYYVG